MLAHENFGSTAVCVLSRTYPRSSERSLAGRLPAEKASSRVPSVDAIGIKLLITYPANQFLALSTNKFWRHLPKCISYHHWIPKQDIVKLCKFWCTLLQTGLSDFLFSRKNCPVAFMCFSNNYMVGACGLWLSCFCFIDLEWSNFSILPGQGTGQDFLHEISIKAFSQQRRLRAWRLFEGHTGASTRSFYESFLQRHHQFKLVWFLTTDGQLGPWHEMGGKWRRIKNVKRVNCFDWIIART